METVGPYDLTVSLLKFGRDDWIRTSDPLTPSQVRYQAAPRPDSVCALRRDYALARFRLAARAGFRGALPRFDEPQMSVVE